MASSRGLSFQLAGSKRTAGARTAGPKKPVSVKDLFSGDSDEEYEEERTGPKKPRMAGSSSEPTCASAVPPAPSDLEVKKVADKLAEFVAKNGRGFEDVTRQRNPGDTPFKFLFDITCADYKYYEYKINDFRSKLDPSSMRSSTGGFPRAASTSNNDSRSSSFQPNVRGPPPAREPESHYAKRALAAGDSVAAMNAFMQLAAKKEKTKRRFDYEEPSSPPSAAVLNETQFDKRKVTAVIKSDGGRGHHMQDFIPPEEMAKFLAKTGDREAAEAVAVMEKKAAIGSDNIGHKLLQKMGWKDGEGIGASGTGMTVPIQATGIKQDNLGIGAAAVGEVAPDDDVYEQYRKRMMLGYKFRPNPLGNPRKAYY